MSVKELQKYTYFSKYARYNKSAKRRETWEEAVGRMKNMHLRRYPKVAEEIEFAFDYVKEQKVLGSQRALQYGGEPIERKHARIYNCCVSYCDRLRFFQESFWLLLCGCGTGFSAQRHHVAKLPPFSPFRAWGRHDVATLPTKTYVVPDTIEGWGDALGVLLSSYFCDPVFPEYANCNVEFDYSQVRVKGSLLSSGAGKAPGPEPLKNSLEKIRKLLDRCLSEGRECLRPIDAYDIVMHASDAVLSGGVRRSATICMFSDDDEEMLHAKTGNWFLENPQRARSNNSVLLLRGKTTRERFLEIIKSVKEFGEPGFVWADSTEIVLNPCCFDPDTRIATNDGLVRVEDLYKSGTENIVVSDLRVGKGDEYGAKNFGTTLRPASKAILTQKQADLYEVVTEHGNVLRVTANHKFPTAAHGRLELRDLNVGDTILLQSGEGKFGTVGSYQHGLIAGLVAGDGTVCDQDVFIDVWETDFGSHETIGDVVNDMPEVKEHYMPYKWQDQTPSVNGMMKKRMGGRRLRRVLENVGITSPYSLKDRVPESVWQGSRSMVIGYLHGLIYTDGSIQYQDRGSRTSLNLRITQANKPLLEDVQALLLNFGIVSRLYHRADAGPRMMPDGKGGYKSYECTDVYELVVNRPNLIKLMETISLFGRKRDVAEGVINAVGHRCRKPERYVTKIKSIRAVGHKDVYCLEEPEANCLIANGLVTGNCEIGMWPVDVETGLSGWQMCNLSEINGKLVKSKEDFCLAAVAAAIIGTLQAGYDEFAYLGEVTERIVRREALLGVSITGMMDSADVLFNPEYQKMAAELVSFTNKQLAAKMGINPAARTTCIKPSGTASCLLGCASGIHLHHARRYMRQVQANKMETPYLAFSAINPHAWEDSVWSANKTDAVITFCCEVPEDAKIKSDMDAVEFLSHVKLTQNNWVHYGKNPDLCTQPWLSHNVSNTITVRDNEWGDVGNYIFDHQESFTAVSLLGMSGDKDYPQAPFQAVYDQDTIERTYGSVTAQKAAELVQQGLEAFPSLWVACDTVMSDDLLRGVLDAADGKAAWAIAVRLWADTCEWFGGDRKLATYCLKDVYNLAKFERLRANYREVDYTAVTEAEDNTKPAETLACSGGTCELVF